MRAISARVWTRSLASRLESGSSMRKTFGSRTIARPRATRCRWPPESAFGLRSRYLVEAQDAGGLAHPRIDLGLRHLPQLQPEGQVVVDAHVRVEGVALEDHRDVAILGGHVVDDLVADRELPVADRLKSGDAAQRGRLAAAGGADQDQELAVGNLKVEVVDRDHVAGEALEHVIEGDRRHPHRPLEGSALAHRAGQPGRTSARVLHHRPRDRRRGKMPSRSRPHRSPTVKPSGKGSSGSSWYSALPVIQALPVSCGTTAR